ncbi:NAD(P)-dependent dehydrogenase (short-subunit alcohol dehydrogenase family) [Xanthomonas sacchari]|uniref:SDR family NAD(P)-dependent oxidoreductase n=1 Tax=Xanthomonas sacchari TaxID=56458 RepID=UPI0020C2C78D|nr:SDR family NAD(P)-dependent oxidoreductase [Xanthomonas sacchari]MDQ1091680.1 NAD(P)-dependent dehydrogenase (short-subunit alcohol dehydrogenase family) [Xanthomonas sacchari]
MIHAPAQNTVLLIGASRGLGLAMAEGYLRRGWRVIATERAGAPSALHRLAAAHPQALRIECVDITVPAQLAALRARLQGEVVDLLFVNAGVKNDDRETVADVATDEFVRVMVTNTLSPMRTIETLRDLVRDTGSIGVMSSGQGSIANNTNGQHEIYRSSKAALNMLMRSFAARQRDSARTLLLMAPGWVRTDLGGPDARLSIDDSIPRLLDTIDAAHGRGGLHYLDYLGRVVPW